MLELDLLTRLIQWLELLTWLVLGHPSCGLREGDGKARVEREILDSNR